MIKVPPKAFLQYAGKNPDRWQQLIDRQLLHQDFGRGIVSDVAVEDDSISIRITFGQPTYGTRERIFGLQGLFAVEFIEFPESLARIISANSVTGVRFQLEPPQTPPLTQRSTQHPKPLFQPNQEVCLKSDHKQRGRVIRPRIYSLGEWYYEVFFSADDERVLRESDIMLYVPKFIWGDLEDLLRDLALVKLRRPLGDSLYALYASRTKFEVYQFKPALKFLANPDQRLLIADEVGLGKTIEAGIIYVELQARIGLDRVLVICPSSLRLKWQDEMKTRFDETFHIYDSAGIKKFLDDYGRLGTNATLRGIVSIETIRRKDIAELFRDVKLDLLIIDEAHHCRNTATLTNAVASILAENADAALLLTATPLQMHQEDLFNLLNILSPGEFDNFNAFINRLEPNQFINRAGQILATGERKAALREIIKVEQTSEKRRFQGNPYYKEVVRLLTKDYISQQELITAQRRLLELNTLSSVFTRTRKRDIQEKVPIRTAFTISVNFTPEERQFYDQMVKRVRNEYVMTSSGRYGSGWVTIMKERQVASCISAVQKKYAQDNDEVKIYPEDEAFKSDFWVDEGTSEIFEDDTDNPHTEIDHYLTRQGVLIPTKATIQKDSKFEAFWEALQKVLQDDPKTKVLVFSFFRETINYLLEKLRGLGVGVRAIHGGYKVLDRHAIIEEFRGNANIRVLISSDVGSEGLDFQFCDTVFNYDLPWNPMKVEQRIGRVDRFGQESDRVRIYNLVIENSIESRILMRLYNRIEIFERSVGDIEAILGDQIRELTHAVFSKNLTPEEEIQRAEKAAVNVLKQKQEMEEFEQNKLQFLGQEAIFSTTIEHTIDSGRFVSEPEVHALVSGYLKNKFPLSQFQQNGKDDPTYTLFANDDLVVEIKAFIFRQRKNDLSAQSFLGKLRPGKEIPLTFSSEIAYQRKLLEFITPRHPLALAAQQFWEDKSEGYKKFTKIKLQTDIAPPGNYYFFIFTIDSLGVDQDARLVPVVVCEDSKDIHLKLSKQLLRLMQMNALPADGAARQFSSDELIEAEDSAMQYMTIERDSLNKELTDSNEAMVNARLSAIEQSYKAKKQRIIDIQKKVSNPSILRMYEGQLNNLKAKYIAKKQEIESRRHVDVSFRLELRGWLEIMP